MKNRISWCFTLAMTTWVLQAGCSSSLPNPNFSCTSGEARNLMKDMQEEPTDLERPLLIMSGWMDTGLHLRAIESPLAQAFGKKQILGIVFAGEHSFDQCRDKVIRQVNEKSPSDNPEETVAVDVVGFSMGGLVARDAAIARTGFQRLNIKRLFTISTPHQGAHLAGIPHWDRLVQDMRRGSPFLTQLDQALPDCDYELMCYVRLGDIVIGSRNAAPKGYPLWWIRNHAMDLPHIGTADDPCILADIMHRLRNEPALSIAEPMPLPR